MGKVGIHRQHPAGRMGHRPGHLLLANLINNADGFSSYEKRPRSEWMKSCASLPVWWLRVAATCYLHPRFYDRGGGTVGECLKAELDAERPTSGETNF